MPLLSLPEKKDAEELSQCFTSGKGPPFYLLYFLYVGQIASEVRFESRNRERSLQTVALPTWLRLNHLALKAALLQITNCTIAGLAKQGPIEPNRTITSNSSNKKVIKDSIPLPLSERKQDFRHSRNWRMKKSSSVEAFLVDDSDDKKHDVQESVEWYRCAFCEYYTRLFT